MASDPKPSRSVGFFFIEGLWAGQKPDYTKFGSKYWLVPEFNEIMEEVVISIKSGSRKVEIQRDGLISYSDSELNEHSSPAPGETFLRIERYSDILNALLLTLAYVITEDLGIKYHTNFELTHHDIFGITYSGEKLVSMGLPQKSKTAGQISKRFLSNVPSNSVDSLDYFIDTPPRPVIPEETLERGIRLFFELTKNQDNVKLLARANKAVSEFASTSFSDALLIAWLPAEIYLYDRLKKYMARSGSPRFNSKRRKNVASDYTVSQVIELLEFAKVITKDEYDMFSKTRKIRNSIIHNAHIASFEEAAGALELLSYIIKSRTNKDIRLHTGIVMNLF